jgi:AcrR family transcriptional regulator
VPGLYGHRQFSSRQEEVLDVVEAVFQREGIRGVRMSELAREASCSRSTLYELAPRKEDLLLLVVDRMMRRVMRSGIKAIDEATGPVEKIQAMLTSGALDFGVLGPGFVQTVREHPPTRLLFDTRMQECLEMLKRLIEDAIDAGEFRPVSAEVLAEATLAVVLHFSEPPFEPATGIRSGVALAGMIDIVVDGLRPRE